MAVCSLLQLAAVRIVRDVLPNTPAEEAFVHCPLALRQSVLDLHLLVGDVKTLDRGTELLLQPGGITRFDLRLLDRVWDHRHVFQVVRTLCEIGSHLKDLIATGQWLFWTGSQELLRRLLISVPNAEMLVLQEADAEIVQIVLENCPKLRCLEIQFPNSSDDFSSLRSTSHAGLMVLLLPSSVRGEGLLTLLRLLPNVVRLRCFEIPWKLLEEESSDEDWWKERMRKMESVDLIRPSLDAVDLLVKWCPQLISATLGVNRSTRLEDLRDLHHLQNLVLRNDSTYSMTFDLWLPGSIRRLTLDRFENLDLNLIANQCPLLVDLRLKFFKKLDASSSGVGARCFCHLKRIRIVSGRQEITARAYRYMADMADHVTIEGVDQNRMKETRRSQAICNVLLHRRYGTSSHN